MRPTIALCLIVKNEVHNLPNLLKSVEGCFDEIHITDTGSTDGTVEKTSKLYPDIKWHEFKWIDDFAAARNYSFSHTECDYQMWLDADDVLTGREAFIRWRDEMMQYADYWMVTYHYASDPAGRPVCSFARERIVRREKGIKWKYFVHEGMTPIGIGPINMQYATPFSVTHMRTEADMKVDRSRNLNMFKSRIDSLDARMTYYYGKELFENGSELDGFHWLTKAIALPDLEMHDRILGIQYAVLAALRCNQFERGIQLAHQGLQLAPNRAEYFVAIGDCYIKMNRFVDAIPFFEAAANCNSADNGKTFGPIYTHADSYTFYPMNQLARIHFQMGNIEKAKKVVEIAKTYGKSADTDLISAEIDKIAALTRIPALGTGKKSDDIVISCHPSGFYEWDEHIAAKRGIGGSETAVVHLARQLHKLTGRKIRVFNNRPTEKAIDGVHYQPAGLVANYMQEFEPAAHIAWRHAAKLTEVPTYVWCHDLFAPGMELQQNYHQALALSKFHSKYIQNLVGLPEDKIRITRNGIDPERFKNLGHIQRNWKTVVWTSSPDRGLERAIAVMDKLRQSVPDAKLEIYYGFDNLLKNGKKADVEMMQALIAERPWISYYGNIEQSLLAERIAAAGCWLYPTNFMETFCITAIEMLCAGTPMVVRKWGALPDTLEKFATHPAVKILDMDCNSPAEIDAYAAAVQGIILSEPVLKVDPEQFSWESVAREWIEFLKL